MSDTHSDSGDDLFDVNKRPRSPPRNESESEGDSSEGSDEELTPSQPPRKRIVVVDGVQACPGGISLRALAAVRAAARLRAVTTTAAALRAQRRTQSLAAASNSATAPHAVRLRGSGFRT